MKINKQKGINVTLILLIVAILVIIGLVVYINKGGRRIGDTDVELRDRALENREVGNTNTSAGTTTNKNVKIQNIDVQSNLVEKATGIIKSVYTKNGKNYIDIDYVVIESCMKTRPNDCPNGVSLKNDNPLVRTFELSPNVVIRATRPPAGITSVISLKDFYNMFNTTSKTGTSYDDYRSLNPWDVVIKNSLIVEINEYFMP